MMNHEEIRADNTTNRSVMIYYLNYGDVSFVEQYGSVLRSISTSVSAFKGMRRDAFSNEL